MVVRMAGSEPSSGGIVILTAPWRHEEERVSGIASMEDRLALSEAARAKRRGARPSETSSRSANNRQARSACREASGEGAVPTMDSIVRGVSRWPPA